jgi:hypothetical protein
LTNVGRPDARSAEIDRPNGVVRSFQVSRYKVEPSEPSRACNLLAKDDCRTELRDKMEEGGPEVPLVSSPKSAACRAERLAGTGAGPGGALVGPSGLPEGVTPGSNSCEPMALVVSEKIDW